jgi:pilus assembly protein TadC
VQALLDYEGAQASHSFSMMVYPPKKTAKEQFFAALTQELDAQNEGSGENFSLPSVAAGHVIRWEKKQQNKQYMVLLFGLITMAAIAIGKKEDTRKAREQRNRMLLAEYPQMLSQMALLLGAGMTVSMAWERIVLGYENRAGDQPTLPIYEEMGITYRQIKDGVGERSAYESFGERLQLPVYRRFSTLLVQNLRKGTVGLSSLLEKEMQEAFDARESDVKKRGEELQTKLLLPMMLMLGLVIVIIMIPAVASFQV